MTQWCDLVKLSRVAWIWGWEPKKFLWEWGHYVKEKLMGAICILETGPYWQLPMLLISNHVEVDKSNHKFELMMG